MNWKRTKTLFIIVFILVNIGLVIIYIDKVNKSHINDSEVENAVDFKQEEIKIPDNLPSVKNLKMQLLTARSFDFSSYAKAHSDISSEQSGAMAKGDISSPIDVSNDQYTDLKTYVKDKVYKGKDYEMSNIDNKNVTFEQTYEDYPIMNNNKARLKFNINNDGKASSYKQMAMKSITPSEGANNEKKQVNTARSAIEALYFNRYLKRNDEVTNARLGYYTVVKEPNVQVLEANWEIKVKHGEKIKTYYVEAVSDSPKVIEE
ncbi:two-component system regulatory protein YycI [Staphylococcus pseudoxylosus]|uniref:two-component system regulatory protein YycI n=1 Tax=Staphylococcus pseudoxylosus TaxID=2282419 RepID=UPI001939E39D|nr:two-component system regulatory protein YycI [Staphylococcus pseudoxylosus]MBM2659164.1 two-component system regulatory protein YycI [Staphylococcus pseudoxylosus]MEB5781869.1 two-component system regulatory protein YycI [Staphylococcus pseudoxylosus]